MLEALGRQIGRDKVTSGRQADPPEGVTADRKGPTTVNRSQTMAVTGGKALTVIPATPTTTTIRRTAR